MNLKIAQFVEVEVFSFSEFENDLLGRSDEDHLIPIRKTIDITRVEQFYEGIPQKDFDADNKIWTTVVMQSGDDFVVNMTYNDFARLMKDHGIL